VGLVHLLDIYTLNHALKHGPEGPVAVNMSPASLSDPDFLPQVLQLLRQSPVRRVHFEFHEAGMDTYWTAFLTFSRAVRTTGHLVAVEIQGHDMNLVARTRDANIAYLVLDPALTQGIVADEGRIALLHGLLKMAALMAIRLEAKGISTQSDIQVLAGMGIHCLTGPAISGASSA
jgi:EAL domain-containing protein (putative c-di-GMP-specific phosphodiesterase class I)